MSKNEIIGKAKVNPRFPLYIPSKGRAEYMITSKSLNQLGVKHFIVVEPAEVKAYEKSVKEMSLLATIVPLDMKYKKKYELLDDLGLSKSTGPGPARNFIWDHSIKNKAKWHWVMDDNINGFYRYNKNLKVPVGDGTLFRCMEDFCLRYSNVGMAGPNYHMFVSRKSGNIPPFVTNTRIYSCNLIRNDIPFRWRGRYNEDTILSLDMIKAGWATIQFNAFLQYKITTQVIKGGNTAEFYEKEGTLPKSRMLYEIHPDVTRIVHRFQRWHHYVDYSKFKALHLLKKPGANVANEIDNYGMFLKFIDDEPKI